MHHLVEVEDQPSPHILEAAVVRRLVLEIEKFEISRAHSAKLLKLAPTGL
jgi:hypothetical protein